MIKNERTFPNYILLLLLWFFITFFSPSYQQEGYAREWPHLIPSVVIFLCNVLLFPAFRWYNHRDVKKQTEPQSLQSDRISPFLCRECGLIYLQAATLMLQFKVRHYDPSQQLNRKMAAFPNGCGHFLFFHIYKLKIWCYNIRRMITSWELSAPAKFDRTLWDESVIFLFTPFHSHATIQDETLCPVSIF